MQLTLEDIGRKAGAATHLYPLDLALRPGEVTVLLGATQSGKNSRMRLMAGFDKPTEGRMRVDGPIASIASISACLELCSSCPCPAA